MNAPEHTKTALAIVTKLDVHSTENLGLHLDWLARLMMLGVEFPGALGAEIHPPFSFGTTKWVLVQRFHTLAQVERWQKSDEH